MRAWAAACLFPWLCAVPPASAADVEPTLSWRCVQQFDDSFHVRCVPSSSPGAGTLDEVRANLPLERLPVAERGRAEIHSTEAWLVPLHVPPSDSGLVEELLRSVLCGKHSACKVDYSSHGRTTARR